MNKSLIISLLVIVSILGIFLTGCAQPTTPATNMTIVLPAGSAMMIEECSNKSYITETADYIIDGTVQKVESKWEYEEHGPPTNIFTYTDLQIEKYVKGTLQANETQIITFGGCIGNVCNGVEDQPIFHEGKKVRIYIAQSDNGFSIVCGIMGIEEI